MDSLTPRTLLPRMAKKRVTFRTDRDRQLSGFSPEGNHLYFDFRPSGELTFDADDQEIVDYLTSVLGKPQPAVAEEKR